MKKGDYVHYISPISGRPQNGRVKGVFEDYAHVVFNCAGNWDDYLNYTGARTDLWRLEKGWKDDAGNPIDTPNSKT